MLLSPHFSLAELTFSQTAARLGMDNTPTPEGTDNLARLCNQLLEPLRALLGVPIHVDSGYRSPLVNAAVGGVITSAHCDGRAADFIPIGMGLDAAFGRIHESELSFDQVIREFPPSGWIHIGIAPAGKLPRRQVLIAERIDGRTVYRVVQK